MKKSDDKNQKPRSRKPKAVPLPEVNGHGGTNSAHADGVDYAAKATKAAARKKERAKKIVEVSRMPFSDIVGTAQYGRLEIKALVDQFYMIQKVRGANVNRCSAVDRHVTGGTNLLMMYRLVSNFETLEDDITKLFKFWAEHNDKFEGRLARWAIGAHGVGAVIAAGLAAHINFDACTCREYDGIPRPERPPHKCPGIGTYGAILRHAGLTSEKIKWEKGQKRPWNTKLKTLLVGKLADVWCKATVGKDKLEEALDPSSDLTPEKRKKILDKHHKIQTDPTFLYVRLYQQYKQREIERNENGMNRTEALLKAETARAQRMDVSKDQMTCWKSGKLQDAGLEARARRRVITIFISHYFEIGMRLLGRPYRLPYAMAQLGHRSYIAPPTWGQDIPKGIILKQ